MITRTLDESKLAIDRPEMVAVDVNVKDAEPLALGKRGMCQALGISERTLDGLVANEGFPVIRLAGKNLYPIQPARDWIAAQVAKSAS